MEAAFLLGLGAQHSRHAARESQGEPAAGGLEVPPVARTLPWPSPPVAGPHAPPPPPWDLAQVCVLSEPLAQEEGRPRRGWPTPRLTTRTRRPARVSEPFHIWKAAWESFSPAPAPGSCCPLWRAKAAPVTLLWRVSQHLRVYFNVQTT